MNEDKSRQNGIADDSDNPKTLKGFIAGTYRLSKKIVSLLEKLSGQIESLGANIDLVKPEELVKAEALRQPPLPGFSEDEWTPPEIEAKPREWCNAVKVWDYISGVDTIGLLGKPSFTLIDMMSWAKDISEATGGKIRPASFPRILSTLVRAEALGKDKDGNFYITIPREPDELREAIERVAKKRKEVAA